MATCRIALPDFSIHETRVCRFHATYYSWDPQTRVLAVERFGIEEPFYIRSGIKEVLVRCVNADTEVIQLRPPRDPVARVAWDYGFYGKKRAPTVVEARASVPEAAKLGDAEPVIADGNGFVFVFAARVKHRQMLIPFRWAATREAGLAEMNARLRDVRNR